MIRFGRVDVDVRQPTCLDAMPSHTGTRNGVEKLAILVVALPRAQSAEDGALGR
jgi:hypothetical protein